MGRATPFTTRCPDKRGDNGTSRTDYQPGSFLLRMGGITVQVARHGEPSRARVRDDILGLLLIHASFLPLVGQNQS